MSKIKLDRDQIYAPVEMIETGLYFRESVSWYKTRFLSPISVACGYIMFVLLFSCSAAIGFWTLSGMFPIKERYVMIMNSDREAGTFIRVTHLKNFKKPSDDMVIALVKNFVAQRENYVLQGDKTPIEILNHKKDFVRSSSSDEVYSMYDNWVTRYNSITGDFIVSGVETRAVINSAGFNVPKKNFLERVVDNFVPSSSPTSAVVYFTSKNSRGRERSFKAVVDYYFKIVKGKSRRDSLIFVVTGYNVVRV